MFKRFFNKITGCWCCYHNMNGSSDGCRFCVKHMHGGNKAFFKCESFIISIFGAGFENYDRNRKPGRSH